MFGFKVLAICGAAVFTVKGIDGVYADAGNSTGKKEDADGIKEICEATMPDIAAETEQEETTEVQEPDAPEQEQEMTGSMECDSEDSYLLAKIAMTEAEGEDVEGKALVMLVVLNRVGSDEFPDSISEVIFQERQFSPVGDGRFERTEPNQECYEALELIHLNRWDESQGALYFESDGDSDWHKNNLQYLFQHGNHYFYTDKELGE